MLVFNKTWKTQNCTPRTKLRTLPMLPGNYQRGKSSQERCLGTNQQHLKNVGSGWSRLSESCATGRGFSSAQFMPAKSWHGINQIKNQQRNGAVRLFQATTTSLILTDWLNCTGHIVRIHLKRLYCKLSFNCALEISGLEIIYQAASSSAQKNFLTLKIEFRSDCDLLCLIQLANKNSDMQGWKVQTCFTKALKLDQI